MISRGFVHTIFQKRDIDRIREFDGFVIVIHKQPFPIGKESHFGCFGMELPNVLQGFVERIVGHDVIMV
jgi:hypothetical protein